MYKLCIILFLVNFVIFVKAQVVTRKNIINENYITSTRIILDNGTHITCTKHSQTLFLKENDSILVVFEHKNHINKAIITLPHDVKEIKNGNEHKKNARYTLTKEMAGKWIFKTLTNPNATAVPPGDGMTKILKNEHTSYYNYQCEFDIEVIPHNSSSKDMTKLYYLIGGGVLALIVIIQTGIICFILKAKNVRRIEKLALTNSQRRSDTARYSTRPNRKPSVKPEDDEGSIYETLDIIQQPAEEAPPPPPIETLPQQRSNLRAPMPLPENDGVNQQQPANKNEAEAIHTTESNISVNMPKPGKVKLQAFLASPTSKAAPEKSSVLRKPSAINQDAISNELNNILKRRQTGTLGGSKPQNLAVPDSKTGKKSKTFTAGLKQTFSKPTNQNATPAKPSTLSRPVTPTKPQEIQKPPIVPKTSKILAKQSQATSPIAQFAHSQRAPSQSQLKPLQSQPAPSQSQLQKLHKPSPLPPQSHPFHSQPAPLPPQSHPSHSQPAPLPPQSYPLHSQPAPLPPQPHPLHSQPAPLPPQSYPLHSQPAPLPPQSYPLHSQPASLPPQSHPLHSQPAPLPPQSYPLHSQPAPLPPQPHPLHSQPAPVHPNQSHQHHSAPNMKPIAALPAEFTEEPEYAEYDDSGDEWTYEPLDPPSKYNYNIYSE